MKLPYIKVEVEYREEETGAPGKVSPALIVGFGLHWAWVYLFMFNGQYILFPEADSMQLLTHVLRLPECLSYRPYPKKQEACTWFCYRTF